MAIGKAWKGNGRKSHNKDLGTAALICLCSGQCKVTTFRHSWIQVPNMVPSEMCLSPSLLYLFCVTALEGSFLPYYVKMVLPLRLVFLSAMGLFGKWP